jgi:hypothetical protein
MISVGRNRYGIVVTGPQVPPLSVKPAIRPVLHP